MHGLSRVVAKIYHGVALENSLSTENARLVYQPQRAPRPSDRRALNTNALSTLRPDTRPEGARARHGPCIGHPEPARLRRAP